MSKVDPFVTSYLRMLLPYRKPADWYSGEGVGVRHQNSDSPPLLAYFEYGSQSDMAYCLAYSDVVKFDETTPS